jgi:anaerobic ribonucleoside-triphosphate reductase
MTKMQDYTCLDCGEVYEYLLHGKGDVATCPGCGSHDAAPVPGGTLLTVIIPTYRNCKRMKAGHQHTHSDRPREKISSQVPRTAKV